MGNYGEINLCYTYPSEGGIWADRTWRKRLIVVDAQTDLVTETISCWVVAGDPR